MKKSFYLIIAMLFITLCLNTFGQANQYPFKVNKSGSGSQSIIFIPGFASSSDVWNETKSQYEKQFTCYTLTMAGFAGNPSQANSSFVNWGNAIAKFIKDNNIEKPIIIGHSMGGGLAMAIAADYPELLSKIIVVDALPCLGALSNPNYVSKENNDCSNVVNYIKSMTDEQFKQMQMKSIASILADTLKHELVVGWSLKTDRTTFGNMYCDFMNTDMRDKISTIKCPALILLEPSFSIIKPKIEEQFKNLKTAQLEYANKGLHFIMYDDKEWYDMQLNKFISLK